MLVKPTIWTGMQEHHYQFPLMCDICSMHSISRRKPPSWFCRLLLTIFRVRAVNAAAIEEQHAVTGGRMVVTANHVSFLDGILIALTSPIHMHYAVEREYAVNNPLTSGVLNFLAGLGYGVVVPMDGDSPHSIRTLLRLLDQNKPVMIFPEGRIGDGGPQPLMPGVQWLLNKCAAAEFSIYISGAEQSRFFGKEGKRYWPRITLSYGAAHGSSK